jgi:hypothetical protein
VSNWSRRWGAVAAGLGLACLATTVRATTVVAPTFDELVTRAQVVFVGDTVDVRPRWVSTPSGRAIVTAVTFRVERVLKGELGGQTVLEFLGGTIGEDRLEIVGMPRFRMGDRDVLFVDNRGKPMSPVVALMHGRFRVLRDPATGRESVARFNFEPLASVASLGSAAPPARVPASKALSLPEFEREIERSARRQPAQR